MIKRYILAVLAGVALVIGLAVPAQAAVAEQARFNVVSSVAAVDASTGRVVTLNVLTPANGVADQLRSFGQCINGHGCAWTDASYGGSFLDIVWSVTCCGCWNLNSGFNDTISSSSTQFGSNYGITWYKNTGCSGSSTPQSHNTNAVNWANFQPAFGWNDSFSSFQIGVG